MDETRLMPVDGPSIRVRYWAAARSSAGVAEDQLPAESALTLAQVRERVVALHPQTRLGEVLRACSAMVGERPVGSMPPEHVVVEPGSTVEFLPPFAGG